MIIDSFSFDSDNERAWFNVFIEPVDIDEKIFYVVGVVESGEGIPTKEKLHAIALQAETISPFEKPVTLNDLCIHIQDAIQAGTWETPFLISEPLLEISAPLSAYEEGVADAVRGLHYNANPHLEGTTEADDWDEGWVAGRKGNFEGLKH